MTPADRQALVARLEHMLATLDNALENMRKGGDSYPPWERDASTIRDVLALLRADEAEPRLLRALVLARLLDEFEDHFGTQGDVGLIEVRRWLETRHVHWTPAPSRPAGGAVVRCPRCRGTGWMRHNAGHSESCDVCYGSGELREPRKD